MELPNYDLARFCHLSGGRWNQRLLFLITFQLCGQIDMIQVLATEKPFTSVNDFLLGDCTDYTTSMQHNRGLGDAENSRMG